MTMDVERGVPLELRTGNLVFTAGQGTTVDGFTRQSRVMNGASDLHTPSTTDAGSETYQKA